jgi:hypothetical protein
MTIRGQGYVYGIHGLFMFVSSIHVPSCCLGQAVAARRFHRRYLFWMGSYPLAAGKARNRSMDMMAGN